MSLSNEDNLRINVLCAQDVKAIRINESSMLITALTARGEAHIELTPNQDHIAYLREIREFLSEKYLDMPGGYPRHLGTWIRMGDTSHTLDKLLLLGEEEAVIALAYSKYTDAVQARYAWWAYQSPEIARNLLKNENIVNSEVGVELAEFLLEFLPFEEKALNLVESVKLCLQGDLISQPKKDELWKRAKRKNPYLVGFLLAGAETIPTNESDHADLDLLKHQLSEHLAAHNPYARFLTHFLSKQGRKWLKLLSLTLEKPTEPDVVIALFMMVERYIDIPKLSDRGILDIQAAVESAEKRCQTRSDSALIQQVCLAIDTAFIDKLKALLVLAELGEHTLNSVFSGRDATGSVMRKHLRPLTTEITKRINTLLE